MEVENLTVSYAEIANGLRSLATDGIVTDAHSIYDEDNMARQSDINNDLIERVGSLEGKVVTVDSALSTTSTNAIQNKVVKNALDLKAPLASPEFTGTPKAPTATKGTNTTQLATTAFVQTEISDKLTSYVNFKGSVTAIPSSAAKGDIYVCSQAIAAFNLEKGDIVLCTTAYNTTINTTNFASYYAVIQTNLIDALTLGESIDSNEILVSKDGNTSVKGGGKTIADLLALANATGTLDITKGGTNATTAAGALSNLGGVGTLSFTNPTTAGIALSYTKTGTDAKITTTVNLDSTPTANSKNLMTSGAIYSALDELSQDIIASQMGFTPQNSDTINMNVSVDTNNDVTISADLIDRLSADSTNVGSKTSNTQFNIPKLTINKQGIVTAASNESVAFTIPTIPSLAFSADHGDDVTLEITYGTNTEAATIDAATQTSAGVMSKDDKKKLDGIAAGAEVNQNAFSKVSDGTTTIEADSKTDTLTVVAGTGAAISLDATNDKITISHSDTSTLSGSYGPTANVTGDDNATIVVPQITVDGFGHVTGVTSRTYTSKNTTYSSKAAAANGTEVSLVTTGEKHTWNSKASTATATTSANGLMSSTDKSKLDGIAAGAEVNVQSDWNEASTTSDAYIKNKPSIPTTTTVSGWGYAKTSDIANTYLSKTDAQSTYLGINAKAVSAGSADTATKASQDASGNNIVNTYARKDTLASATVNGLMSLTDKKLLDSLCKSAISSSITVNSAVAFCTTYDSSANTRTLTATIKKLAPHNLEKVVFQTSTDNSTWTTYGSEILVTDEGEATSVSKTTATASRTALGKVYYKCYAKIAGYDDNFTSSTVSVTYTHPIFYGMSTATTASAAFNALKSASGTKYTTPTTTSAREYKVTASANNSYIWIFVPTNVTPPTKFTSGGAPVSISVNKDTSVADFYAYRIGSVYSTGTSVTFNAV